MSDINQDVVSRPVQIKVLRRYQIKNKYNNTKTKITDKDNQSIDEHYIQIEDTWIEQMIWRNIQLIHFEIA